MKYKRLYIRLSDQTLQEALQRYHYEDNANTFYKTYRELVRKIEPSIYYKYDYFDRDDSLFIFTLGREADTLQKTYEKNGDFAKAYALNCLCMELLTAGYHQIAEIVRRERRQFLQDMIFTDSEEVEQYLQLVPKQTVIFHGITAEGCTKHKLHDCKTCNMQSCIYKREG